MDTNDIATASMYAWDYINLISCIVILLGFTHPMVRSVERWIPFLCNVFLCVIFTTFFFFFFFLMCVASWWNRATVINSNNNHVRRRFIIHFMTRICHVESYLTLNINNFFKYKWRCHSIVTLTECITTKMTLRQHHS